MSWPKPDTGGWPSPEGIEGAAAAGGGGGSDLDAAITMLALDFSAKDSLVSPNSVTTSRSEGTNGVLSATMNNPAAVYDGASEADVWVFDPTVLNENYDPANSIIVLKADVTSWPNGSNGDEVIAIGFGESLSDLSQPCTLAALWDSSASGGHRAYGMTASAIGSYSTRVNTTSLVAHSIPRSGLQPVSIYLKGAVGNAVQINGGQNGVEPNAILVAIGCMGTGSTASVSVTVKYRIFALEELFTT